MSGRLRDGVAALERGDPLAALPMLLAAAAKKPDDAARWIALSRAQLELADAAGAVESAGKAVGLDPRCADAVLQQAAANRRLGDREEAARNLAAFAAAAPGDLPGLRRVLRRALAMREWDAAGEIARAVLALAQDDEDAAFAVAAALQAAGDGAGARRLAARGGPGDATRAEIRLLAAGGAALPAWALAQQTPDRVLTARVAETVAEDLLAAGHLTASLAAAERALLIDAGLARARGLREIAQGRLAALRGEIPDPQIAPREWQPEPGRSLLVTEGSLPRVVNGGTVRTQEGAIGLAGCGIEEAVLTEPGFPWTRGWLADPPEEVVDGVCYLRALPPEVRWEPQRGVDLPALRAALPVRDDAWITGMAQRIAEAAERVRPEVLRATRHPRHAEAATLAGEALGLPVIYEVRDWCERNWREGDPQRERGSEQWNLLAAWETRRMKSAARVVVMTDAMRAEAVARGVPPGRVVVAPNAPDVGTIVPMAAEPGLRERVGIPAGSPVIGHLSALSRYEGLEDLIDAMGPLGRACPDAILLVVGDNPHRAVLETRAAAAGVAERVRFAGRVPPADRARWYALMDVIVIPRRATPATVSLEPSKMCEAMATGRPVVASGLPPIRAVIRHGETGVLTPPGEPEALAGTLAELLADPARRERIGAAGRAWVVANRTIDRTVDVLASVHRETVAAAAAADGTGGFVPARRREPARILHIVATSNPWMLSGSTVRTGEIVRWQRDAGIDPHVATTLGFPWNAGAGQAPLLEIADGSPHYRLAPGEEEWRRARLLDRETALAGMAGPAETTAERAAVQGALLGRLIGELRPQAVHGATSVEAMAAAVSAGRAAGLPVIVEVRGFHDALRMAHDADATPETPRIRQIRERATAQMFAADRVVTLSDGMAAEIAGRGVPARRIVVVPNGVDVERYRPRPRDEARARRASIPAGTLVLGTITTLSRHEGLPTLLEAVALLRAEGLPVVALIVGGGEMGPRLEQVRDELGLGAAAVLPGQAPWRETPGWMSLIDVFAMPRPDTLYTRLVPPLKMLEAMAMERAVVVSDLPALREQVVEGVTGEFVRPGDAADLAAVAGRLLRDPERRRELGTAGRAWVTVHRNWRDHGRRYMDLYREMGLDMGRAGRT
ncbi:MAG: glycosyltransferase [Chloroflexota bacterium]